MTEIEPAAPAQADPSPAPTPTAADQAVLSNDVSAYRSARAAERSGKPLAPAPVAPVADPDDDSQATPPAATAAPTEPRPVSKRQQDINDRVREAVERATGDLRAEVARLKAPAPAAAAPAVARAAVPPADPEPDPDDATKYPDGQFDRKFIKDLGAWSARQEHQARETAAASERSTAQQDEQRTAQLRTFEGHAAKFTERLAAVKTSDPDALSRVDPAFLDPASTVFVPTALVPPGAPVTFGNAVADVILQSDNPVGLMLHLSDKAEAARLSQLSPDAFYREIGRIEARLEKGAPPTPKPVTSAPTPPTTLGTRPADPANALEVAVAAGDQSAYKRERQRERAAQQMR